ncbi:MAG: DUF2336 domain-containing protein [Alphaproteobacteria bacterium]|nr:DUF2336 domain-containing protein [Alphaproteobacteria bacterium]
MNAHLREYKSMNEENLISAGGTAGINPMLVGLYDAYRFYEQNRGKDADWAPEQALEHRKQLCDQMAHLLSVSMQVSEREMVADVLVTLLRQATKDLKAALADRICALDNAPLRLVLQLVNDDISIAKPLLENSPVLNDLDLLYIIQSRDSNFWQAIAARARLTESVVDALAETQDVPTATILIGNETITLSLYAAELLEELAETHEELAQPLLSRSDIPEKLVRKLYGFVGDVVKEFIVRQYGAEIGKQENKNIQSLHEVRQVVDDVVGELAGASKEDYKPTAAMLRAAEMFMGQGKLEPHLMVRTLKRGQIASFIAQLSVYVGLSCDLIFEMLKQDSGQGLAVLAKAIQLSKEDFLVIYSMTRKLSDAEIKLTLNHINTAAAYYDRITLAMARQILSRSKH